MMTNRMKLEFERLKPLFVQAGKRYGFAPYILAAIAWRESNFGVSLDPKGFGDKGNGFGIMQVDSRSHKPVSSPSSIEHIMQASEILNNMRNTIANKFRDWNPNDILRGAIAAYNFGADNVRSIEHVDVGTTNNNYSADVLAKAKILKDLF